MEASQPEPQTEAVPAGNSKSRGTQGGGYFEDKMINGCGSLSVSAVLGLWKAEIGVCGEDGVR